MAPRPPIDSFLSLTGDAVPLGVDIPFSTGDDPAFGALQFVGRPPGGTCAPFHSPGTRPGTEKIPVQALDELLEVASVLLQSAGPHGSLSASGIPGGQLRDPHLPSLILPTYGTIVLGRGEGLQRACCSGLSRYLGMSARFGPLDKDVSSENSKTLAMEVTGSASTL